MPNTRTCIENTLAVRKFIQYIINIGRQSSGKIQSKPSTALI